MKWKSDEAAFLNQVSRLKTSGTDWGCGERNFYTMLMQVEIGAAILVSSLTEFKSN